MSSVLNIYIQILVNGAGIGVSYNPHKSMSEVSRNKAFCSIKMFDIDSSYFSKLEDSFYNLSTSWNFLDSPSFQAGMFNTPSKPRLVGPDFNRMEYYYPIEINSINIANDLCLLQLLHHMDTVVCKENKGRIHIKIDVNIFSRFLKFVLLQFPYSDHLRKRFAVYLSPWHTYKHALLVLFRSNANFIWLRLWKVASSNDSTCRL